MSLTTHLSLLALAAIVVSRGLSQRAQAGLSPGDKEVYFGVLARFRSLQVAWLVALGVSVVLAWRLPPHLQQAATPGLFLLLAAGAALIQGLTLRQLRATELPRWFLRRYALGRAIAYAGVAMLLLALLVQVL